MPVKVHVSTVIDRPIAEVFRIHAQEHVRNHPRWDPLMQLEQVTDGPISVGTIIKRINSHSGSLVEGTMEIVEFEPNRSIGMIVHDGSIEMITRAVYEAEGEGKTTITLSLEIPGMDESMAGMLTSEMDKVAQTIKQFIESEVNE
jgi:uncharacterized membrane protein